ncbi:MAG: transglutaminase-like domain-containing protein [Candidatus Nanoarchaeia archaeon]
MTAYEQIKNSIEMTALVRAVITDNPHYVSLKDLTEHEYLQFKEKYNAKPEETIRKLNGFIKIISNNAVKQRHIRPAVELECIVEDEILHEYVGGGESPIFSGIPNYLFNGYTELANEPLNKYRQGQEKFKVNKRSIKNLLVIAKSIAIGSNNDAETASKLAGFISGFLEYNVEKTDRIWEEDKDKSVMINRYIVEGIGVCRHMAVFFQLMAQEAGIPAKITIGKIEGQDNWHMWNRAKLDDKTAKIDIAMAGKDIVLGKTLAECYDKERKRRRDYRQFSNNAHYFKYSARGLTQ